MKGALRVALLLFTALPAQRWLLAFGTVIMAVGYLLPGEARFLALIGLVIAVVPTQFASGALLRYIAAPRVTQLIPHVRLQMLGGMAAMVLIFATAFTVVSSSLGTHVDYVLLWLRLAAGASMFLIIQFPFVSGPAGGAFWFILTFAAAIQLSAGTRDFIQWIGQSPEALIALLVVSWCGFASWFLRVRSFKTPSIGSLFSWGAQEARPSYQNAVRAFLFGNPSLLMQVAGGLIVVATPLALILLAKIAGSARSFGEVLSLGLWLVLGVGAYAGLGGWMVVRRSKVLWLRCGLDRLELFQLCEREAWKSFIATASAAVLLAPLVWLAGGLSGLEYAALLFFQFCAGACLLYLGLMHVRGWQATDVLSAMGLLSAWGTAYGSSLLLLQHPWMLLALCAAMLAAAFALRLVALHRWRRIDWLVCKPPAPHARLLAE
ncbi:MAG: hypothetical protein ABI769_04330 [Pseudomonadota bacterium]